MANKINSKRVKVTPNTLALVKNYNARQGKDEKKTKRDCKK